MIAWLALCGALSLAYGALLLACRRAWMDQPTFSPSPQEPQEPRTSVSVLVAARNEAAELPRLLASLLRQETAPAEVLVIDDHSEDATAATVRAFGAAHPDFPLHLIELPHDRTGKKAALEAGAARANGTLLACTDADCEVPPGWIRLMALAHEQTGAVLIAGPVAFHGEKTAFERFQTLDFLGMVGLAAVGLHRMGWRMANGANLAYTREAFAAVGGFAGHRHLASGDDMFLAQRMAQVFPQKLFFLKNARATVLTRPETRLGDFVRQRLRWGSKSRYFPERRLTSVLALVWLLCGSMAVNGLLFAWLAGTGHPAATVFGAALLAQASAKGWADFNWLAPLARFFGRPELLRPPMFLYASIAHGAYITVVGTLSALHVGAPWKGRRPSAGAIGRR
jgi:cellulose synthase/poly-beta-1,6-N-acetylglucosamine synthase-like glycosyltransferase